MAEQAQDHRELVKYDQMCRAIEEAHAVDEVKAIRDKAIMWELYSKQALNTENELKACQIRLRSERKAGQILRAMVLAGERQSGRGNHKAELPEGTPELEDLGISKKQSAQWQKLGLVPQREFERALKEAEWPTTKGIIRATAEPRERTVVPVSTEALWLWGRLLEFERKGYLEMDQADAMETMTAEMLDDTHRLAPQVAAWLRKIGATPR